MFINRGKSQGSSRRPDFESTGYTSKQGNGLPQPTKVASNFMSKRRTQGLHSSINVGASNKATAPQGHQPFQWKLNQPLSQVPSQGQENMRTDNEPYKAADVNAHAQAKAAYYAKRRSGTSNSIGNRTNKARPFFQQQENAASFSRNELGQVYADSSQQLPSQKKGIWATKGDHSMKLKLADLKANCLTRISNQTMDISEITANVFPRTQEHGQRTSYQNNSKFNWRRQTGTVPITPNDEEIQQIALRGSQQSSHRIQSKIDNNQITSAPYGDLFTLSRPNVQITNLIEGRNDHDVISSMGCSDIQIGNRPGTTPNQTYDMFSSKSAATTAQTRRKKQLNIQEYSVINKHDQETNSVRINQLPKNVDIDSIHSDDSEEALFGTYGSPNRKVQKSKLFNIVLCEGGVARDQLNNVDKLTTLISEVEKTCFLTQPEGTVGQFKKKETDKQRKPGSKRTVVPIPESLAKLLRQKQDTMKQNIVNLRDDLTADLEDVKRIHTMLLQQKNKLVASEKKKVSLTRQRQIAKKRQFELERNSYAYLGIDDDTNGSATNFFVKRKVSKDKGQNVSRHQRKSTYDSKASTLLRSKKKHGMQTSVFKNCFANENNNLNGTQNEWDSINKELNELRDETYY